MASVLSRSNWKRADGVVVKPRVKTGCRISVIILKGVNYYTYVGVS